MLCCRCAMARCRMLECSGAVSAVNADLMCCKDDIIKGSLFLFLHICLSVFMFVVEHKSESIMILYMSIRAPQNSFTLTQILVLRLTDDSFAL